MHRHYLFLLGLLYVCSVFAQPSITLESFRTGLDKPVSIKHANDDRLFVVEQDGRIQILNSDGALNSSPFLNIESIVGNVGSIGDERGLLSVAFHPNYAANGFFYVNYINNSGNTVISRFSVSSADPDLANSNSEQVLLTITQPFSNHNGGDLAFGPDGYLYISSGDGGSSGDPGDRAQNLTTLLGKILRLDVDNTSNGNNYAIPVGNPFIGNSNALDEIWSYGHRNTWKFSFDRQTGDLWSADVGQGSFEEINKVSAAASGLNYGWRCYEGNEIFNITDCPDANTLTFPVAVYAQAGTSRCSVTGGYRYRGSLYPGFSGLYFFADYCSNEIGILEENGAIWDLSFSQVFAGNNWVTFGEDVAGELYIAGISSGTIYKIVDVNLGIDTFGMFNFTMYPNPAKEELNFDFKELSIPVTIAIYDIRGKLLRRFKGVDENLVSIPIKNFAKGLYLVKVSDLDGNKINKKLIVN